MHEHEHTATSVAMVAAFGTNQPLTMSSREIANLCEKRHDHVMRDIRKMLNDLREDAPKFGAVYDGGNGESRPCFNLPKDLTLTLVAGYSTVLRKRIIDRWLELEAGAPVDPLRALNDPATMRGLLLTYSEKVLALKGQVEEMTPKAEAFDRLDTADGNLTLRPAAKVLGVPEHKFKAWMQVNRWAFRQSGKGPLQAYREKIEAGYLDHKLGRYVDEHTGEDKTSITLVITPKGMARLAQLLPKGV